MSSALSSALVAAVFAGIDSDDHGAAGFVRRSGEEGGGRGEAPARGGRDIDSDRALIERILARDVSAFDELYLAYFDPLTSFVTRIVGASDRACDIVQDTFFDFWRGDARRVTTSIRAYLYGAARYRALHLIRRQRVESRAEHRPEVAGGEASWHGRAPETPDEVAEWAMLDAEIRALIEGLSERQRTAVELRWVDALSATEIGVVMGISEAAVRKLLRNAESKLIALRERWGRAER